MFPWTLGCMYTYINSSIMRPCMRPSIYPIPYHSSHPILSHAIHTILPIPSIHPSIHPEVLTYRNTLNANILIVSYRLFYLHFNYKNNRFLISDTYGNFRMPLQHVWYHKRRSQLPSRDRAVHVQAEYSSSYVF